MGSPLSALLNPEDRFSIVPGAHLPRTIFDFATKVGPENIDDRRDRAMQGSGKGLHNTPYDPGGCNGQQRRGGGAGVRTEPGASAGHRNNEFHKINLSSFLDLYQTRVSFIREAEVLRRRHLFAECLLF